MPHYAKILDGVAGGVTGDAFKLGVTDIPYTLYASGGFAADTVQIQSAPTENGPWINEFGPGGGGLTPGADQNLVMVNNSVASIEHKIEWIRAVTGGSMTGTATVSVVTVE